MSQLQRRLTAVADRINPKLSETQGLQRLFGRADAVATLVTLPLALVGLVWQIQRTDWTIFRTEWFMLLLLSGFYLLFSVNSFRIMLGVRSGNIIYSDGSFNSLVSTAGAFIFGPTLLWLDGLSTLINLAIRLYNQKNRQIIGTWVRNSTQTLTIVLLGGNLQLWLYERLNGRYPLPDFSYSTLLPAFLSLTLVIAVPLLIFGFFFWLIGQFEAVEFGPENSHFLRNMGLNGLVSILLQVGVTVFGIFAAGIYTQLGITVLLFFLVGVSGAALLARRLSQTSGRMQQRARELTQLEKLSQAIMGGPLDTAVLPDLLNEYVPNMFPSVRVMIWLLPDDVMFRRSLTPLPSVAELNPRLNPTPTPADGLIASRNQVQEKQKGMVVSIMSESQEILGGILFIASSNNTRQIDIESFLPSIQALAAQIATAIRRVQLYNERVDSEKMARELEIAGEIQASFLPAETPQLPGWQLFATLEAARTTSGDFYDFVPLENGRLALVVADVADKGTGAALYMALSRTLLRTYIQQFPDNPALALEISNERLLSDASSDQFVTVFVAVLDPVSGEIIYANAGHNPGFWFNGEPEPRWLTKTGIPLGMFPGMVWQQETAVLQPGDQLVLYSDGITEAQNYSEAEYGEQRLIEQVRRGGGKNGRLVETMADQILTDIQRFADGAPQFDDITLLILSRNASHDPQNGVSIE